MPRFAALFALVLGLVLLAPTSAQAADDEGYDLPKVELKRIPPRFSWDVGAQIGFGEIGYWRDDIGWWGALGFHGAWGRHFGLHRVGMGFAFIIEGPAPIHMSMATEANLRWDWVNSNGGFALGAAIGPTLYWHHAQRDYDDAVRVSPMASMRIGWSQPWTRVGKRLFFAFEPKVRWIRGALSPMFGILIGSGRGY